MKNEILRKCAGCRAKKNREEMFKITLQNGVLHFMPDTKTTGRSVYVCRCKDCIKKLIKSKGIKRALKFTNEKEIKKIEDILTSVLN